MFYKIILKCRLSLIKMVKGNNQVEKKGENLEVKKNTFLISNKILK